METKKTLPPDFMGEACDRQAFGNGVRLVENCGDFAVIYKSFGILSEDGADGEAGVPKILSEMLGGREVYTVHRLDRTTEGLMIYALTKKAAAQLSGAVSGTTDDTFEKHYAAYICPAADSELAESGEMRDYLYFDRRSARSYPASKSKKDAKEAVLTYRLTDSFEYKGAVVRRAEIELKTGRTHQIRSQFSIRKAPLLGDGKYGCRVNYKGAALFSVKIRLVLSGKERIWHADQPAE